MSRKTNPPPVGPDICEAVQIVHDKIDGFLETDEKVEVVTLTCRKIKFASIRKRKKGVVAVLNGYRPESTTLTPTQQATVSFIPKKGYENCGDWLMQTDNVKQAAETLLRHYGDYRKRLDAVKRARVA